MSVTPISRLNVEALVTKMLNNPNINIKMIPDSIEKKIYTNILTALLASVDEILGSLTLHIGGKHIKLDLMATDGDTCSVYNDDLLERLLSSVSLDIAGHTLKASLEKKPECEPDCNEPECEQR